MAQKLLRDYLQETEDAISSSRIDDAQAHCQVILQLFPEALEAQRLLGEVYLAQGLLDDAQQAFDWVLTNDPENVITYCDRALISERTSDYDTALDCYQQAYELSRGNKQIRREFNELSAKAGQQGFMFSRAGLARLYMRGNLLTQAIQEWETVLAMTPDRLDARVGLLETCWREGLYDRVEQLATQLLRDVPGCEKALLLLAYVSSTDIEQAQELLKRAEALDPDLVMAHELFADVIASRTNDPFVQLLKKPPVRIDPEAARVTAQTLQEVYATNAPSSGAASSVSQPSGASWSGLERWQSQAGLGEMAAEMPTQQEIPVASAAPPIWSNGSAATKSPSNPSWSGVEQQEVAPTEPAVPDLAVQLGVNPWEPVAQSPLPPAREEPAIELWQTPVEETNGSGKHKKPDVFEWGNLQPQTEPEQIETWQQEASLTNTAWTPPTKQEKEAPAPPAWLSMLAQSEPQQLSGAVPLVPPTVEPALPELALQYPEVQQPISRSPGAKEEPAVETFEQDDESFFGPAWLKSLGATTMDEDNNDRLSGAFPSYNPAAAQPEEQNVVQPRYEEEPAVIEPIIEREMATPVSQQSTVEQQNDWEAIAASFYANSTPPAAAANDYSSWLSNPPEETAEQREQKLVTTLEELEKGLQAQGFVQLQPNSLANIAQNVPAEEPEKPLQGSYQETALSSALAELGQFAQPAEQEKQPTFTTSPAEPVEMPEIEPAFVPPSLPEEPAWMASLRATPVVPEIRPSVQEPVLLPVQEERPIQQPAAQPQPVQPVQPQPVQEPIPQPLPPFEVQQMPAASMPVQGPVKHTPTWEEIAASQQPSGSLPRQRDAATQETAAIQPVRNPTPAGPVWNPTPQAPAASTNRPAEARGGSAMDALLGSELETTMKRPAVRLQPMLQRVPPQREVPPPPRVEAKAPVRTPPPVHVNKDTGDGNVQSQERLIRGYQHQLAGDYDAAMQEYRLIIRGAPELLGEVVSNVRALLKIAPKYAAGYRVLGDAYMRQGEYLQAMEAYNKALTMAKKAKG